MSETETLKNRWRPEYDALPSTAPVRKALHETLASLEMLAGKRSTIATDPRLSDVAKATDLRTYAASEAKTVAKAQRTLAKAGEKLNQRKLGMTPTVADKGNVAAALLRGELRQMMRTKSLADQSRILFDRYCDPTLLEAVFEAPCELSGLDADMRQKLLDAIVERHPAAPALQVEAEALEVLSAGIRMAENDLQDAAKLTPYEFPKWFESVTKQSEAERATEATELETSHVTAAAKALPWAARHSLVESLLAANSDELVGAAK